MPLLCYVSVSPCTILMDVVLAPVMDPPLILVFPVPVHYLLFTPVMESLCDMFVLICRLNDVL
jgi:hypothetical protein